MGRQQPTPPWASSFMRMLARLQLSMFQHRKNDRGKFWHQGIMSHHSASKKNGRKALSFNVLISTGSSQLFLRGNASWLSPPRETQVKSLHCKMDNRIQGNLKTAAKESAVKPLGILWKRPSSYFSLWVRDGWVGKNTCHTSMEIWVPIPSTQIRNQVCHTHL